MMNQSEQINELAGALAKVQGEIQDAHKDKSGYGYQYADLGQVLQIARPLMSSHGLSFSQFPTRPETAGQIALTTILMHTSGQYLSSTAEIPAEAKKGLSAAQCVGSGLSYLRRYALAAVIGITQTDDDGAGGDDRDDSPRQQTTQRPPRQQSQGRPAAQQSRPAPAATGEVIDKKQAEQIAAMIRETGTDYDAFAKHFGIAEIEELTPEQAGAATKMLQRKQVEQGQAA